MMIETKIKLDIEDIKSKIFGGVAINEAEAIQLSQHEPREEVYNLANEIREKFVGNSFDLCSITNARSGKCQQDCSWCSQSRKFKTAVEEYEMVDHKLAVETAIQHEKDGVNRYSLVTSGRRISAGNLKILCGVYKEIKKKSNISLCASMGLVDKHDLEQLKEVGIKHYHCNLETSRSHFPKVCTTHTYDEKIRTIKHAQEAGLDICSGGIFGMGETMEQRIEMAFELQRLGVLSIPLNILMPIEGTDMEGAEPLKDKEVLTSFAMFRIINPKANIRFAGGRMNIKHLEEQALKAGINSALVGNLLTTIGSNVEEDKVNFAKAGFKVGANLE